MMGSETEWAEKKRLYRDSKKTDKIEDNGQKRTLSDKSKSIDIYSSKEEYIYPKEESLSPIGEDSEDCDGLWN
jgi:hypothetical protein